MKRDTYSPVGVLRALAWPWVSRARAFTPWQVESSFPFSLLSVFYPCCHCCFTVIYVLFHGITFLCFLLFFKHIPCKPWEICLFHFHHNNLLIFFLSVMLFFFFLSTLTYCILNVGLEYKYIFLVALFLFFLNFPDGHSFPSSETWLGNLFLVVSAYGLK